MTQNQELLKQLAALLEAHRSIFKQERIFQRVKALVFGEIMAFGRHTLSQIILTLGLVNEDWTAWYRLFSRGRFPEAQANAVLLRECLAEIGTQDLLVVGGDGTQTPRSSPKIEGTGWLRNVRTPPFKVGIHLAQRWFHGALFLPPEAGYSRAIPLRFIPAFTAKAWRRITEPLKEWEAALVFIRWVLDLLRLCGRGAQRLLFLGDGNYETVGFWSDLPAGVIALLRSAKNRALFYLPPEGAHGRRKYGAKAPSPQAFWQRKGGWQTRKIQIRGRERRLRYRVEGPFLRKTAPACPLMLIIIGGETYSRQGRRYRREPVPYLVNAVQNDRGDWVLPLPIETLLFWAWQRWEMEVCHRELKSNFGLGQKQAWQPQAALRTVQMSAWIYALCILAGYRSWGLCQAPPVPSPWWRGAGRWSFNTLWRAYRAALWGEYTFQATWSAIPDNWLEKPSFWLSWRSALYAASHL